MKRLLSALLLCAAFVQVACTGDDTVEAPSVRVSKADGVVHVRVASLAPTDVRAMTTQQAFTTARAAPPIELYQVTAARFLPDGRLAVANAGTGEILVLDAAGGLAQTIGGKGAGPGEFAWISALDVDTAGTMAAYDPRQGRITRFTTAGDVIATQTLAPPNRVIDIQPLTLLDGGRFAAVYGDMRVFGASGEARDTTPLMVFNAAGTSADTLGMWAASEWAFRSFEGGASRANPGFGRSAQYAGRNGRFAIGSTDSIDVSVFDRSGRLAMRITGGPGGAVSAADVERWRAELIESYAQMPEPLRRGLDQVPHRATFPGFESLVIDDAGRVWIGSHVAPGGAERDWLVLESDGTPYGRVTLPGDAQLLDAAGDRVALLLRDELDEPYIRVLQVVPE